MNQERAKDFSLLLKRFEQAWKNGPPPEISDFFKEARTDEVWRRQALLEFVSVDLEYRWHQAKAAGVSITSATKRKTGTVDPLPRTPRLEDYVSRYRDLGSVRDLPLELIAEEYRCRHRWGDSPRHEQYVERFQHLGNALLSKLAEVDRDLKTFAETSDIHPHDSTTRQQAMPREFGRYRILRLIGKGGMGTVFLAEDPELERQVAIKVPFRGKSVDEAVRARFKREAKAAAALRHPNICPVFEVAQAKGIDYLAMAFIDGQPLSQHCSRKKQYPVKTIVKLTRKLALAMDEAHKQGIIHRDLKPSNIMIDRRSDPIIMDFGLARREGREDENMTETGQAIGTPCYMAPEQIAGHSERIGPGCDIYSLGVILYQLLTGRLPFQGDLLSVFNQVATQNPKPVSEHRPDIDPALDQICLKALAKQPEDRYVSMDQFAAVLGDHLKAIGSHDAAPAIVPQPVRNQDHLTFNRAGQQSTHSPSTTVRAEPESRRAVPVWARTAGGGLAMLLLVTCAIVIWKQLSARDDRINTTATEPNLEERSTRILIDNLGHTGGPMTIEIIVRPGSVTNDATTVLDTDGLSLQTYPYGGRWAAVLKCLGADEASAVTVSESTVVPGETVQLSAQWDGSQLSMYVNGQLEKSSESSLPIKPSEDLAIGDSFDGDTPFLGTIDEVRISDFARHDGNYQTSDRFESDDDTLALYRMNQIEGDAIRDLSGNGRDGKVVRSRGPRKDPADSAEPADPLPAEPPGLIVPAYFYPGGEGEDHWESLISAVRKVPIVAVVNPANGPGQNVDPAYTRMMGRAKTAGVKLIGYISTRYGERPLEEVKGDVDRWIKLYPSIEGVFLDEQDNDKAKVPYYGSLYVYVRNQQNLDLVVSNPGTRCSLDYLTLPTTDVACTYENRGGFRVENLPLWVHPSRKLRKQNFVLVYGVDSVVMQQIVSDLAREHIGFTYITDDDGENPWDRLPSYWNDLVGAVEQQ